MSLMEAPLCRMRNGGTMQTKYRSVIVQGYYVGFNIRNGVKLSHSLAADLTWLCLAVA